MRAINTKILLLILAALTAISSAVAYRQTVDLRREQALAKKQEQIKRSMQSNSYDWDGNSPVGKFRLP